MPLIRMPFGASGAQAVSRLRDGADMMANLMPDLTIDSAPGRKPFAMTLAHQVIGDLDVVAHVSTPARWQVDRASGWVLKVPMSGSILLECDARAFRLHAGHRAMLIPPVPRRVERSAGALVNALVDPVRVNRTCAAILGDDPATDWIGERVHALELDRVRGAFGVFEHICGLIDVAARQPGLAAILSLDDLCYRWLAIALVTGDQLPASHREPDGRTARIDVLCDMVRSAREQPLTLTEMEQVTGLGRRALQKAFHVKFGISPMEWQRRERMGMARSMLQAAEPGKTITEVAHAMGFSSSAAFATLYKRYFKETPSETLNPPR